MKSSDKSAEKEFSSETARGTSSEAVRGFLSNGPLYSLLALYMPVTIFAALIFIMQAFFSFSMNSALLIICALISGVFASLYCDFMKDNKSSQTAANIRGGIIIVIFFYALSSLTRFGIPINKKFIPHFSNIISVIGALYAWIYVISLKKIFSARKHFEIYSQMYQGKKLQQVLFEDSSFLLYTDTSIKSAKFKYLAQLIIIAILTIICAIMNVTFPVGLYILLIVIFFAGISILSFFEIIKREHYLSAEGVSLNAQDRVKRITAAAIVSFICLAAALLLASDKSIIPFSVITGFFLWLLSLFRSDRVTTAKEIPPDVQLNMEMRPPMLPYLENARSPGWEKAMELIQTILKYGLIILAIALFIRFMISPLLDRSNFFRNLTFGQRLVRIIKELFKGIAAGFVSFFTYLKQNKTMSKLKKYDAEEIKRAAESLLNAYSSAKKSDVKHSVTLFARLIVWGSDVRRVTWQPFHAPGEFCSLLAEASRAQNDSGQNLKLLNEDIIRCAEIFEKALYSFEALSSEERKEFKELIEKITSSPY